MKVKQTILGVLSLGLVAVGVVSYAQPAYAAPVPVQPGPVTPPAPKPAEEEKTPLKCSILPQSICDAANEGGLEQSGTWALLLFALKILTVGIGIVAVGAIGFAGFLYATASDNEGQVKQAKEMIRNTVIGILAYGAMYVLLQFLIPGGVFT